MIFGVFFAVANNQTDGYISAKSIIDIYHLTRRAAHSDEVTRNEKDYKKSKVNVLSPSELVNISENTDEN